MVGSHVSHPTVLVLNLPSCAILAVDSRIYENMFGSVISDEYNKTIELHRTVFLGCFGDCHLIDQVREALVADIYPPSHRSMGEFALFVQNTVNTVLDNSRDANGEINRRVEFVLVGCVSDNRYYVYKISKGEDTWMHFARREVGRAVTAGSDHLRDFVEDNNVDENMTEEQAVQYALRGLRRAIKNDFRSDGMVRVVAITPGSSTVHTWEKQNDLFSQGLHEDARLEVVEM